LKGLSLGVEHKRLHTAGSLPTPVFPAMHDGTQPPLGVMETTHPSLFGASTDVVPAAKLSRNFSFEGIIFKMLSDACGFPHFLSRFVKRILFSFEGIRITGTCFGIVRFPVDALQSFLRIFF